MTTLKQSTGAQYTRILGFGAARGDVVVPNSELVEAIDSSDEWIRQRTGIITRKRASKGVDAIDLAETASLEAIKNSGITPNQIDAVIVSTISNVAVTPSMSSLLTERIGAAPAPAYDVGAACAGYTYAIAQADALVRSGAATYVLVVGAEKLSQYVHPEDRSISFLLGDGAGAAVVGPADEPGISAERVGLRRLEVGRRRHERDVRGVPRQEEAVAHHAAGRPDRLPMGRLGDGEGCQTGSG